MVLEQRRPGPSTSPIEIVVYLRALSGVLIRISDARRAWIQEFGPLIDQAYRRDPTTVARSAAQLGRSRLPLFREARIELGGLRPPADCAACHAAAVSWLDQHVTACERLIRVGDLRDVKRLGTAREPLDEARAAAQRINAEYARLVADLRRCIPRRATRSHKAWLPLPGRLRRAPSRSRR